MTFLAMKKYQPAQSAAVVLASAHAAVIDELLNAVFELEKMQESYSGRHASYRGAWERLLRAQRAYFFVARVVQA